MMENQDIQSTLHKAMEDEIAPSEISLWPKIRENLAARKSPSFQQGQKMTPNYFRRAAVAALALVFAMVILLATPQGQAFAMRFLSFFIRAEGNTLPVPEATLPPKKWVDVTSGVPAPTTTPRPSEIASSGAADVPFAADCGMFPNLTCSVEAIRGKVNFAVKEIGKIPDGLYFLGATGGPESISLYYNLPDNTGGLTLSVEPWKGQTDANIASVGASAVVEKVKIREYEGEYVKGGFLMDGDSNTKETVWNEDFGLETLRWVDGDVLYSLMSFSPEALYGKERLVAIAESMTMDPVEKLPMPVTESAGNENAWDPYKEYPFSIAEMEAQAGFKLHLPGKLPEGLTLAGARINPDFEDVVDIYYPYLSPDSANTTNGLSFLQQKAPDPANCVLCGPPVGDYNTQSDIPFIVSPKANVQIVQIGSVTGNYVEGVWQGTDCCGWEWGPTSYVKTLVWWQDGVAHRLTYWGMELEEADLITIAASIK